MGKHGRNSPKMCVVHTYAYKDKKGDYNIKLKERNPKYYCNNKTKHYNRKYYI